MDVVACYVLMLLWDGAVLFGTAYLVGWMGWSPWWFLLTLTLLPGSSPKSLIKAKYKAKCKAKAVTQTSSGE